MVCAMTRDDLQKLVKGWCTQAFGTDQTFNLEQRGLRLTEECLEAAQACRCDPAMLHKLIDYVYSRPVGTLAQEMGGVGVTLLALGNAAGFSADQCEFNEILRVMSKPIESFTKRNQEKNDAGFLAKLGDKG